jgi:hypothetical protein
MYKQLEVIAAKLKWEGSRIVSSDDTMIALKQNHNPNGEYPQQDDQLAVCLREYYT